VTVRASQRASADRSGMEFVACRPEQGPDRMAGSASVPAAVSHEYIAA
jgi:hypothetical protein